MAKKKEEQVVQEEVRRRFLVIFKSEYQEVVAKDWWEARSLGAKWIQEKYDLKLTLGLISNWLKIIKLEDKFTKEDFKELL